MQQLRRDYAAAVFNELHEKYEAEIQRLSKIIANKEEALTKLGKVRGQKIVFLDDSVIEVEPTARNAVVLRSQGMRVALSAQTLDMGERHQHYVDGPAVHLILGRTTMSAAEPHQASGCCGLSGVRPEVRTFMRICETVLKENDYKGGWKKMSRRQLEQRLQQEVRELLVATDLDDVVKEACDVANFAMMIADVSYPGRLGD